MLTRIDLRDTDPDARDLAAILPRADLDVAAALESVAPLIEDVRVRGAAALRDAAERFDHVRPEHLRVPASAIERALAQLDPAVREGLELSIAHNRAGHAAQLPVERVTEVVPGGRVVQRWIPVRRVGLYAPGGLAVYPSSVVMNVVPAQVAGVERIALASPPQAAFGGLPHPTILAACGLLGVEEVYAVGGAQAIAMFAYGAADDDGAPTAGRLAAAAGDSPESRPNPEAPTEILPTSPGPTAATPAAKAAALVAGLEETSGPPRTGEEEAVAAEAVAQDNSRRRRRRRSILATLVLVLALVVAGFLGYQWTQSQYYVTIADGKVAIFQGIPQALGPLELSHLVESYSEPDTATLDDQMIRRLNETVSQPSLEAAREYINVTVMQHRTVVVLPQATATPAPSATPAPAQPAPTAPSAQPEPGAQTTAEAA